ncbi:hypothetical protein SALBM135S_04357 [Streptomyces alboniger]
MTTRKGVITGLFTSGASDISRLRSLTYPMLNVREI